MDRRPAPIAKVALLRRLAASGAVAVLVDDDPDVIRAARAAGFPVAAATWLTRPQVLVRAQEHEGRT